MPFKNQTEYPGAGELLRKEFCNLFGSKPYVDIELAMIDEQIVLLEKKTGRKVADLSPQEVCRAIGCDGLIFGTMTSYEKVYTGVYSQLSAAAEIRMVNAKTGKEVAHIKDSVDYYEGDIPLTPVGAIVTALATAANIREVQEMRMINELSYKLIEQIPEPEGVPAIRRPEIRSVVTNVSDGPFGRGGNIKVGLFGEPGIVADFDIGNFRQGLPMHESQPGVYVGDYAVLPGDNTWDMPIIARLTRPSGPKSHWNYSGGLVTIDTTAPPPVSNLRIRSLDDRVELVWDYPAEVRDLSGFLILRSTQPLSGFAELAKVEQKSHEDRRVKPGGLYYYRIVALDRAGNQSEFSAMSTELAGRAEGPAVLSGLVLSDTVLSGVYNLNGQYSVPSGITLTIGPGTTIVAGRGAEIRVHGKLVVDGQNGQVRLFSRKNQQWSGVVVEGGSAEVKGIVLSGSVVGIKFSGAAGVVADAAIIGNLTGISVSGTSPVVVRNCWVAGNVIGIEMTGTDSKVLRSTILRNTTGLLLSRFTGEIRDNLIIDNEKNLQSLSPEPTGHSSEPAPDSSLSPTPVSR